MVLIGIHWYEFAREFGLERCEMWNDSTWVCASGLQHLNACEWSQWDKKCSVFGSLPLSPLTCLAGDTSFPAISSTSLHRYYLNWTELDDAITKFNNEMPSAENWVLKLVIYIFDTIFLFWYCAVALLQLYC